MLEDPDPREGDCTGQIEDRRRPEPQLLIPERARLEEKMALNWPLKPVEMQQGLQDFHDLCIQDLTVLYLRWSRPVNGACPMRCCQLQQVRWIYRLPACPPSFPNPSSFDFMLRKAHGLAKTRRNQHIQSCVR
jgi:hypothetical protein